MKIFWVDRTKDLDPRVVEYQLYHSEKENDKYPNHCINLNHCIRQLNHILYQVHSQPTAWV